MRSKEEQVCVVAFLKFESFSDAGFALPVFARPSDPKRFFLQRLDELGKQIAAFEAFDETEGLESLPSEGPAARIGTDPIYVFYEGRKYYAGPLNSLEGYLRDFSARHVRKSEVNLQISELIGTIDEKRKARIQMERFISQQSGRDAAQEFYRRSTLHASLWSHLLAGAPNKQSAAHISASQHLFKATLSAEGKISLDLSALNSAHYALTNIEEIIRCLEMEFQPIGATKDEANPAIDVQSENIDIHVAQVLKELELAGRQEERIAIIFDELLSNPLVGFAVLQTYKKDRGQFATKILEELLRSSTRVSLRDGSHGSWIIVQKAIQKAMSEAYPQGRGPLLYFLAKHLGRHRPIREMILNKLRSSRSIFIQQYYDDIIGFLMENDKSAAGRP